MLPSHFATSRSNWISAMSPEPLWMERLRKRDLLLGNVGDASFDRTEIEWEAEKVKVA